MSNLPLLVALAGPHLTALHLSQPHIRGDAFARFFLDIANTQSVRSLTIDKFDATRDDWQHRAMVSPNHIRAGFAALTHLHSLALVDCPEVDHLIPHVLSAPKLRQLTIEPHSLGVVSSTAPWEYGLWELLQSDAASQLTVNIRLAARGYDNEPPERKTVAFMRELKRRYTTDAQLNSLGGRFVVLADSI